MQHPSRHVWPVSKVKETCQHVAACAQGTFLSPSVGDDLDAMAAHAELLRAAREVRAEMAAMQRLQQEGDGAAAPTLRRSQSLSAAEAHLAQFDRLCKARPKLFSPLSVIAHAVTYLVCLHGLADNFEVTQTATQCY